MESDGPGWRHARNIPQSQVVVQYGYCLAEPGSAYAIYLPHGGTTDLDLSSSKGTFKVQWFNPREGGGLQQGTVGSITGPGKVSVGQPPNDADKDWVALVSVMSNKGG